MLSFSPLKIILLLEKLVVMLHCTYYDMSEQDIKTYFESKELSDKERKVVDELIKAFANPY